MGGERLGETSFRNNFEVNKYPTLRQSAKGTPSANATEKEILHERKMRLSNHCCVLVQIEKDEKKNNAPGEKRKPKIISIVSPFTLTKLPK